MPVLRRHRDKFNSEQKNLIHSKRVHSNDTGAMDMKKAKFQYEAAAMAGHEGARCNLGTMEAQSGNMGRAVKIGRLLHQLGIFVPCALHS